ncbi:hypothetical protein F4780DRAFT_531373 [Xylariomycetidae sp. FL0641]|nr:hypothetical protein F4780DRAFT_531373 [Xylariomycetidae sp. FL0641]
MPVWEWQMSLNGPDRTVTGNPCKLCKLPFKLALALLHRHVIFLLSAVSPIIQLLLHRPQVPGFSPSSLALEADRVCCFNQAVVLRSDRANSCSVFACPRHRTQTLLVQGTASLGSPSWPPTPINQIMGDAIADLPGWTAPGRPRQGNGNGMAACQTDAPIRLAGPGTTGERCDCIR